MEAEPNHEIFSAQALKDYQRIVQAAQARWGSGFAMLGEELQRAILRAEIVSLAGARADADGGTGSYAWAWELARVIEVRYFGNTGKTPA